MTKPVFHCLFEQSGTFKRQLIDMGFYAYDYDISDGFGETDFKCDLFEEIKRAYFYKSSIFDRFSSNDYVFAFFPCIRFSCQFRMMLEGNSHNLRGKSDREKVFLAYGYHQQLSEMYDLFCMLFDVAYTEGFKMIVENPFTGGHYLKSYFPIKPSLVIQNRRELGDYFEKPTQFWFVNCKPECNVFFECIDHYPMRYIEDLKGFDRSKISSCFASNFIRRYVLPGDLIPKGYEFKGGDMNGE